jgi:hypothetical protein
MTTEQPVAYTNNGVLLCLNCVKRFDLTNPSERHADDEFLPVPAELLEANIKVQRTELHCGVPTCHAVITSEGN